MSLWTTLGLDAASLDAETGRLRHESDAIRSEWAALDGDCDRYLAERAADAALRLRNIRRWWRFHRLRRMQRRIRRLIQRIDL